ncbi:MAG: alpha/beta hydrolase [Actinobacteria bacterium]|nr:alpha/beta hydrolase [Actinomycetota bacterium]
MGLYDYKKRELSYSLEPISDSSGYKVYDLHFDSPAKNGVVESDTVRAIAYLHDEPTGKTPIIFVHGIGMSEVRFKIYSPLIEEFVKHGFDLIMIILPYHYIRTPKDEGSGSRLLEFNADDTFDFFYKSVVEIRSLLDVLDQMGREKRSYYLCGVSLGAMISSLVMGVEGRISKGVLLISGGNWEKVHWGGVMRFVLNGQCSDEGTSREICHKYYSQFPEFLEEFKKNEESGVNRAVKRCFLCDPLIYAHKIDPKRVLMINALFDGFFSRSSTLDLWKAFGRPELHWLLTTHSTTLSRKRKIAKLVLDFLNRDGESPFGVQALRMPNKR